MGKGRARVVGDILAAVGLLVALTLPAAAWRHRVPVVNPLTLDITIPVTSGQVVGTVTALNSPTSWRITGGTLNYQNYLAISNTGVLTLNAAGATHVNALTVDETGQITVAASNNAGTGVGTVIVDPH